MRPPLRKRDRRRGVTLVEIMIVIVIMALVATGVSYSVGALARTKLRAAAMHVLAAARYARHRALTEGKTVRVVIDLDEGTLGLEEATGQVTLNRRTDDDEEQEEAVDPWETAQLLVRDPDEPRLGASAFGPIVDEDGDPIERFAQHALDGVTPIRFVSPHETEPREHGRVSFYYFPNGTGERTFVVLRDSNENVLTVELDALSARGQIHGEIDFDHLEERYPRDPG